MEKFFDIILIAEKGKNALWNRAYQIESTLLQKDNEKQYLGDSIFKKCRFCGKDSKETTFKKKAHIIPEFMGNKYCFSNFECDNCNQYFGTLEDSLFNFAGIYNVFSGIKGKKSFPKYKGNKEGLTLFAANSAEIKVQSINGKDTETFINDKKNERIIVDTNQHSYIPQNAFKALVKKGVRHTHHLVPSTTITRGLVSSNTVSSCVPNPERRRRVGMYREPEQATFNNSTF